MSNSRITITNIPEEQTKKLRDLVLKSIEEEGAVLSISGLSIKKDGTSTLRLALPSESTTQKTLEKRFGIKSDLA